MGNQSFVIRPARSEDAETVFTLIDALADYEKLARPDDGARRRFYHDAFERNPPRFWVYLVVETEASGAETTVGYAIILETYSSFLARPTLYIEDLFVQPEARGRGAGSACFQFLSGEAHRRGCGRMEWVCLNWNELAIGFYERRGAEHLDGWRSYRLSEDKLREAAEEAEKDT